MFGGMKTRAKISSINIYATKLLGEHVKTTIEYHLADHLIELRAVDGRLSNKID